MKLHENDATVTVAKESLSTSNENDITIDSDTIADSVLSFFQVCGLNPANLSDDQVEQYIELIVKSRLQATDTAKASNDRAGSVETLNSSDSTDDSWQYV